MWIIYPATVENIQLIAILALAAFFQLGEGAARAYFFQNPDAAKIHSEIESYFGDEARRLEAGTPEPWEDVGERLATAQEVERAFTALDRSAVSEEDLFELKYELRHFRKAVAEKLFSSLAEEMTAEPSSQSAQARVAGILQGLVLIPVHLSESQVKQVMAALPWARSQAIEVLARQGVLPGNLVPELTSEERTAFGPQRLIPIGPEKASKWSFSRWAKLKDLAEYPRDSQGRVIYRSLHLAPGDFLIADLSSPSNGLFTGLAEKRNYAAHFGMFVELESEGRRFPSVIEIHERGVRAVPLHVFLGPKFTTYAEVYRLKQKQEGFESRLETAASELLTEKHGYDFWMNDGERRYLTCSEVGAALLERAGESPIAGTTRLDPAGQRNFGAWKLPLSVFVSPTDYLKSPRSTFVGVIENGQLEQTVADDLVVTRVHFLVTHSGMEMRRLPESFGINQWGVRQIQKHNPLGYLFMKMHGFSYGNFPAGSATVMALVELFGGSLGKSAVQISSDMSSIVQANRVLSIHDLEQSAEVTENVDRRLVQFKSWFR